MEGLEDERSFWDDVFSGACAVSSGDGNGRNLANLQGTITYIPYRKGKPENH